MTLSEVDRLLAFLTENVEDNLHSIVHYYESGCNLVYIRDDVERQYTDEEIADVIKDLGIDAFDKQQQEGFYVHSDLTCTVRCFDDANEMNFLLSDREGIAVGLDAEAFVAQRTFLGKCMETVGID